MEPSQILSWIGTGTGMLIGIPQLVKTLQTKQAGDLSATQYNKTGGSIMNPIALGLIGIGVLLLFFGIFSIVKSKKIPGVVFSSLGLLAIATPFVVSYFLAR